MSITAAETTTGVLPFADRARNVALAHTVLDMSYNEADLAKAIASEGLRPSLPTGTEEGSAASASTLSESVERCWRLDPNDRPTFVDVQKELDAIATAYMKSTGISSLRRVWRPPSVARDAAHATATAATADLLHHEWVASGSEQAFLPGTYPPRFPPHTNPRRVVNAGVFSTCGARGADKMEDRHVVINQLDGIAGAHFIGVFDGHRGYECAEFAHRHVAAALTATWHAHSDPGEALARAFQDVDGAFVDAFERSRADAATDALEGKLGGGGNKSGDALIKKRHPGCTACVVLVLGDVMYVANAGDCRTVMCVDYVADAYHVLTTDHAADTNERERVRIENSGGLLRRMPNGRGGETWRVGTSGLAVTRAMGDADCKGDGVTSLPEITKVDLGGGDEYIVVACDGLWDVVSNEECVKMIKDTVKEPGMCAKRLGSEAMTRMSGDNITVVVAFLKDLATSEKVTWERAFTTNAI